MSVTAHGADLDSELRALFAGKRLEDPYPIWTRLREDAPVHFLDSFALVSRFSDVKQILADRDQYSGKTHVTGSRAEAIVASFSDKGARLWRDLAASDGTQLARSDGEPHDRLRRIMHRYFTPRVIAALEQMVQEHVDELLNGAAHSEQADAKQMFQDLAARVMTSLIGSPLEDRGELVAWANRRARWLGTDDESIVRDAYEAMGEFRAYVRDTILAGHRRNPGSNPLVSAMMEAEDEESLSTQETIENIMMLLAAGVETTSVLLSSGTTKLLSDGEKWAFICEDTTRVPAATEELLRYVSPVQWVPRVALRDTELHGEPIAEGQTVLALVAPANRDPEIFENPDELDLARTGPAHVGLGFGAKFCLGASLVRMEARVLITTLAQRYPDTELLTDPAMISWQGSNPMLRSMRSIPIRLAPTPRRLHPS